MCSLLDVVVLVACGIATIFSLVAAHYSRKAEKLWLEAQRRVNEARNT